MAEREEEEVRPGRWGLRNILRYGTAIVAYPAFICTVPHVVDKVSAPVQEAFIFGFAIAGVVSLFRTLNNLELRPNEADGTRLLRGIVNMQSDVVAPYLAVATISLNALARLGI